MEDFILDDDGDISFDDKGIVIGESTLQHQQLLLVCNKGDFKQFPDACVGVAKYLKDQRDNSMLSDIKSEFEKDGMIVSSIVLSGENISIDASYKTSSDLT